MHFVFENRSLVDFQIGNGDLGRLGDYLATTSSAKHDFGDYLATTSSAKCDFLIFF